jgi:hypothetical protein
VVKVDRDQDGACVRRHDDVTAFDHGRVLRLVTLRRVVFDDVSPRLRRSFAPPPAPTARRRACAARGARTGVKGPRVAACVASGAPSSHVAKTSTVRLVAVSGAFPVIITWMPASAVVPGVWLRVHTATPSSIGTLCARHGVHSCTEVRRSAGSIERRPRRGVLRFGHQVVEGSQDRLLPCSRTWQVPVQGPGLA